MSSSYLEDPSQYIIDYSEKTKYSCIFIGIALLLVIIFFVGPVSLSSTSTLVVKSVIVGLIIISAGILFKAVAPVIDVTGALDTDLFPDLKKNFIITMVFIAVLLILGVVVIRT